MTAFTELDNPVWVALTTAHAPMARGRGDARRYASSVSPLAGLREPTPAAFADLRALVEPAEKVALFTTEPPPVPDDWEVVWARRLDQMVCSDPPPAPTEPPPALGDADVPDMLALVGLTEPGPFLPETIRMGRYHGVRAADGQLAAMAGERLGLDGHTEISAVCTHPAHRGRGHAQRLLSFLVGRNLREGRVPFLHVKTENGAKVLYERLGFRIRFAMQLTVVSRRD